MPPTVSTTDASILTDKVVISEDGTKIFAQAAGDSHLPSLVFVHGFGLSALVWKDVMQDKTLLESFYLIAYDVRGHGRSGKPDTLEEYSSLRYAQDFDAVIKGFGVTSPPILVAWSLGGAISADVTAHLGADALAGIAYVSALPWLGAGAVTSTEWSTSKGPGLMTTSSVSLAVSTRMEFTTSLFSQLESIPAEVLWSWFGSTFLQDPAKLRFQLGRTQDTTNLLKAGENGLPVLFISGEPTMDQYVNVEAAARVVVAQFRNATEYMVENGSHAFFYEEKAEFVCELLKFAKRVSAT